MLRLDTSVLSLDSGVETKGGAKVRVVFSREGWEGEMVELNVDLFEKKFGV